MLSPFRRAFRLLPRRRRAWWLVLVPLSVAAAVAESAAAAAVYLLIKVFGDPSEVEQLPFLPTLLAPLAGTDPGATRTVLLVTLLVALFYLAKNGFLALVAYLQTRILHRSRADLSRSLYERYLAAPYEQHLKRSTPTLVHRITNGVYRTVTLVLAGGIAALSEGLVVIGILAVLITVSPVVTLVTVAALSATMGVLLPLVRRRFFALGERENRLRRQALETVQQGLEGFKVIRVLGREGYYRHRFEDQQSGLARVGAHHGFLDVMPRLLIESLFIAATLLVVTLVVLRGEGAADVLPLLGLYAYAGFRVIPSMNRILMHTNNVAYGAPSVDELAHDLDPSPPSAADDAAGPAQPLEFRHSVRFDRVTYSYERGRPVLDGISFAIERGSSLGIVGATGAGKSTIVDLLLGLLGPAAGRILVDGVDIQHHLTSWRQKIGYVPQVTFLIDDTLRRNIAFALTDAEIDEQRLAQAVRLARLEELLASLPDGLATRVGERGTRLSGGQRQRLAIARALYHDPELLVFDEATSALDSRSEREIAGALGALRGEKTAVVIAHRLSTVQSCDRLIFLRGGKVEAHGSYDSLVRESPEFCRTVGIAD